jgi:hypothetical protein
VVDGTNQPEPFTHPSGSGEGNNDSLLVPELHSGLSSDSPKEVSLSGLNTNAMTSSGHLYADRVKRQEIIDYGRITEASMMTPRSSERVRSQANADATQLERAIALAQKKDDTYFSGTCEKLKSRLSFLSLMDDEIMCKASKLGVSLGASDSQIASSIKTLNFLKLIVGSIILKIICTQKWIWTLLV